MNLMHLQEAEIALAGAVAKLLRRNLFPRGRQASGTGDCMGATNRGFSCIALQQHRNAAVTELHNNSGNKEIHDGGTGNAGSVGAEQVSNAAFWPSSYPGLLLGAAAAAVTAFCWCSFRIFKS